MARKKYLTDYRKVRRYLNAVINDFNSEEGPDVQKYRALTYMIKTMLDCFQFEQAMEIEKRIDKIEKILEVKE